MKSTPLEKAIAILFKKHKIPNTVSSYVAFLEGIDFVSDRENAMTEKESYFLRLSIRDIIISRKRKLKSLMDTIENRDVYKETE